jgi:hypothetical protein
MWLGEDLRPEAFSRFRMPPCLEASKKMDGLTKGETESQIRQEISKTVSVFFKKGMKTVIVLTRPPIILSSNTKERVMVMWYFVIAYAEAVQMVSSSGRA